MNKGLKDIAKLEGKPQFALGGYARKYEESYGTVVCCLIGPAEMKIDAQNGRLLWLSNQTIHKAKVRNPLPDRVKPTKTKEEIIEIAERYRQLAMGDFPEGYTFAEPKATFNPYGHFIGCWEVEWRRLLNGYWVFGEFIEVTIQEKFGCELYYFVDGLSCEPCPTEVKINEEQARKIAWAAVPVAMKKWPWIRGDNYTRITKCELLILKPNYIFDPAFGNDPVGLLSNRKTRLGYRIYFYSARWGDEAFEIWIDAATGELLGASLPMSKEKLIRGKNGVRTR